MDIFWNHTLIPFPRSYLMGNAMVLRTILILFSCPGVEMVTVYMYLSVNTFIVLVHGCNVSLGFENMFQNYNTFCHDM